MNGYKGVKFCLKTQKFFTQPILSNKKTFFTIGKWNNLLNDKPVQLCHNGYHYCKELRSLYWWWTLSFNHFYFKIESKGIEDFDLKKRATKNICLKEEINIEEILTSIGLTFFKKQKVKGHWRNERIVTNTNFHLVFNNSTLLKNYLNNNLNRKYFTCKVYKKGSMNYAIITS